MKTTYPSSTKNNKKEFLYKISEKLIYMCLHVVLLPTQLSHYPCNLCMSTDVLMPPGENAEA